MAVAQPKATGTAKVQTTATGAEAKAAAMGEVQAVTAAVVAWAVAKAVA